jgi:hypothetical protein
LNIEVEDQVIILTCSLHPVFHVPFLPEEEVESLEARALRRFHLFKIPDKK